MSDHLKQEEEARRERHWDARRRWQLIQETIAWAEAQATVQRNTRANRLAQQARQNAREALPPTSSGRGLADRLGS